MSILMARSLDEALEAVEAGRVPFAGGTDLFLRPDRSAHLVGLDRVEALKGLEEDGETLAIGAGLTWQEIIDSDLLRREAPLLVAAARAVGGPALRHMATVGGNVCTASPGGDGLNALWALEAEVELLSLRGRRSLPLERFVLAPGRVALERGEIVQSLRIARDGRRSFFRKVGKRRTLAIAVGSLAALWKVEAGKLRAVRLVFGSMAPLPLRARDAEACLEGVEPEAACFARAAERVPSALAPVDDVRASADYRRRLASGLVQLLGEKIMATPGV
jgi:xanthine dehydrogenase FAD-binding subunit